MKKLLIVLCYKYPYEPPTEQFLDMEIQYFLELDVDIVFVPVARMIDENRAYESIGNERVSIHRVTRKNRAVEIGTALLYLPHYFVPLTSDLFRCFSQLRKNARNGLSIIFQNYVQAEIIYRDCAKFFDKIDFTKCESVTLYSYWLNSAAYSATYLKKRISKKFSCKTVAISRAHGDGDLYIKGMEKIRVGVKLLNSGLDAIYSISEDGYLYLKNQNIKNAKIARLGVEKSSYSQVPKHSSTFLVVSCSVINDNKRVLRIAQVLSKVSCTNLKWVHFGDGPLFDQVNSWCKNNMPSNIDWQLMGFIDHSKIMKYYADNSPDLFINFSRVEGIPVSIMEAMSYAIPVVATNAGAMSEIVNENVNGVILPVDFTDEEAVTTINRVLSFSDVKLDMLKRAAFDMWNKKYNANSNFSVFISDVLGK